MEQLTKIKEPLSQNNRQTIKNRRKYGLKRSRAAFLRLVASNLVPGAETDPKKSNIGQVSDPLWEAKSRQNRSKNDHNFWYVFWRRFLWIQARFWMLFALFSWGFSGTFSNMPISWFLKDLSCVLHTFPGSRPSKIDQNLMEKRHRIPDTLFAYFLMDLASILTSNLELFGHRGPSKNVSKIRARKRDAHSRPIFFLRAHPGRPPTAYNL